MSSVSAASSANVQPPTQDPTRQAFSQLVNALGSGDLTVAQNAYAAFQQVAPGQGSGPFAQAISQIGDALQSGDIGKAQQALAQLQHLMQSATGAHHHHSHHHDNDGDKSSSSAASASTTNSTPSTLSTNQIDVTA